jgi:hypothetical protein
MRSFRRYRTLDRAAQALRGQAWTVCGISWLLAASPWCWHRISRFPPKVAVIQCGADNPYGHPTPQTLDRLQRVGAKIFRNDEDGDVIATIKDQELKVATTKR